MRRHHSREKTGALLILLYRTCRQRVAAGCGTVCVLTGRAFAWSEAAVGGVAGVRCAKASKAQATRAPWARPVRRAWGLHLRRTCAQCCAYTSLCAERMATL